MAQDRDGNPVAGVTVEFTPTLACGPAPITCHSSGTVFYPKVASDVNGIAAASWFLGPIAGNQIVQARGSPPFDAAIFSYTAVAQPGPPATIDFIVRPSLTARSGAAITQPVLQVFDVNGNRVTRAGVPVSVVISSGGGMLVGETVALTDASGVATFRDLVVTGSLGKRTISFSAPGTKFLTVDFFIVS